MMIVAVRDTEDRASLERQVWDKLELELAKFRRDREQKGDVVSTITREELEKKLNRVNSPMIAGQGWSGSVPAGRSFTYSITVNNPDPVAFGNFAVAVFIGNRNAIVSNDLFMADYDQRFGPSISATQERSCNGPSVRT